MPELETILTVLLRARVRFVVVGGYAAKKALNRPRDRLAALELEAIRARQSGQ